MPNPSHDQVRSIGDVQVLYKFNLKFVKFPKKGTYPSSNDLNLRCESFQVPEKSIDPIKVTVHGHDVQFSGRAIYQDEIELVFVETIDNKIKKFMREWREACNRVITGAGELKVDTEAKIILEMLGTTNNPIWQYDLTGCLYRGGTIGTMEGGANDAVKPNLRLGYDYFDDKALV